MSIPRIDPGHAPAVIEQNFEGIKNTLVGGVSLDNFRQLVIEGTTATDVDSVKLFSHSMTPQPIGWFPLIGDVYIQEISSNKIDVRSTKPEVNFKIVLLGGQSVTNESVRSVGGPNYEATGEYITETAPEGIDIETIIDARVNIHPVVVQTMTHEYADGAIYRHVVNTATHFYVTQNTNINQLVRINRSTGVADTLVIYTGSDPLSAMVIYNSYLYVTQIDVSQNKILIHKIDLTTFTVDSTVSIYRTGAADVREIIIDGTHIYVSCGGNNSYVGRCEMDGTNATTLTLSTTTKEANGMADIGSYIWVTEYSQNDGRSTIYKVEKSSFTVVSTWLTGYERWRLDKILYYGGYLWMPAAFYSAITNTSQDITYPRALLKFDPVAETAVIFPIGGTHSGGGVSFAKNLVEKDGFLYMVSGTTYGTQIVEFDTTDGTQRMGWYPFECSGGISNYCMNGAMNIDAANDALPIVFNTGGAIRNFEYFEVNFSKIDDSYFW